MDNDLVIIEIRDLHGLCVKVWCCLGKGFSISKLKLELKRLCLYTANLWKKCLFPKLCVQHSISHFNGF